VLALFDSGVGGLTVLAALWRRMPTQSFLYLSDQENFPYGDRPPADVRRDVADFAALARREGAEALVLACNTASALACDAAAAAFGRPVHGVIAPVARRIGLGRRVGVLATTNTCRTHAYRDALAPRYVIEVACPDLIALAEAGGASDRDVARAAAEPLRELRLRGCDRVVLGCTHLPHFAEVLGRLTSDWAELVDPGEALAAQLAAGAPRVGAGRLACATTGDAAALRERLQEVLPQLAGRALVRSLRRAAGGLGFVDEGIGG